MGYTHTHTDRTCKIMQVPLHAATLMAVVAMGLADAIGPEPALNLGNELNTVVIAVGRAAGTAAVLLQRASAALVEMACQHALGMSLADAAAITGDAAYLIVLLITFPLALLQGASPIAIFDLGVMFLATELASPYAPGIFWMCAAHPKTTLVAITLVCMAVAKRAGHTVTIWDLRVPQADNPVLWEAIVFVFIFRMTLPWSAANVALLLSVCYVRWGAFTVGWWRRRSRANKAIQTQ